MGQWRWSSRIFVTKRKCSGRRSRSCRGSYKRFEQRYRWDEMVKSDSLRKGNANMMLHVDIRHWSVTLYKVGCFLATTFPGLGEPSTDGGRHVAGAAATARGATGFTDQSQAGGRGRGWAMQTGTDANQMLSWGIFQWWSCAILVWYMSDFVGVALCWGRAAPHQIKPTKQNQGSRRWNPKAQEPGHHLDYYFFPECLAKFTFREKRESPSLILSLFPSVDEQDN